MKGRLLAALALGLGLLVVGAPGGRASSAPPRSAASGGAGDPGVLYWPVSGFVLTQGFGCTSLEFEPVAPECPGGHFHAGLDLAAPAGAPVSAAAAGLVVLVERDTTGYGTHVVLDHGSGVTTLYGHLLDTALRTGDLVFEGDPIGRVGSTGNSTGPHLHFEVRVEGHPVDPESHLPARTLRGEFQ